MKILGYFLEDGRGCRFFTEDDRPVCEVRELPARAPMTLVRVLADGRRLECLYDFDSTLVPGLTRVMREVPADADAPGFDRDGAPEAWRVTLTGFHGVTLRAAGQEAQVLQNRREYAFFRGERMFCVLRHANLPGRPQDRLAFVADVPAPLDPNFLLPMLAYPAMRFLV